MNNNSYKKRRSPISSYGIILYRKINNKYNYLLVQRKDTYAYVEFLRGKYRLNDVKYIKNLITNMSVDEIKKIETLNFEELWNLLWLSKAKNNRFQKEFDNSKQKFEKLKEGLKIGDQEYSFEIISKKIKKFKKDSEWGFPKGRKKMSESIKYCAMREFEEETNYNRYEYKIIHQYTFKEVIVGINSVMYEHYYFVAKDLSDYSKKELIIDKNNNNQFEEIKSIKFIYFYCYIL